MNVLNKVLVDFRECDQDSEKGSASTSLMKSIIGPSLNQQNQLRSNPPISKVNSSMTNMAVVGNMPSLNSGNYLGINSDSDTDFLWDSVIKPEVSVGSTGNMNIDTPVSTPTSFMSQLRITQHLQRSMSTQPQRISSAMVNNNRPGNLAQYGQRSTSLDHGLQGQGQMQQTGMAQGQKSPAIAHSPGAATVRTGNFQFPAQRGRIGYNRQSPAASPIQGFNAPFPPRTPSPMLSPSPG